MSWLLLLIPWGAVTLVMFAIGASMRDTPIVPGDERRGARMMLTAWAWPFWSVWMLFMIVRFLVSGFPDVWRDAWGKSNT